MRNQGPAKKMWLPLSFMNLWWLKKRVFVHVNSNSQLAKACRILDDK